MAGVDGVSVAGPTHAVVINANGQLGTATSTASAHTSSSTPAQLPVLRALIRHQAAQLYAQGRQLRGRLADQQRRIDQLAAQLTQLRQLLSNKLNPPMRAYEGGAPGRTMPVS